eukprot:scaffold97493_cov27-Phaeocystis_antarctica.AAC.1
MMGCTQCPSSPLTTQPPAPLPCADTDNGALDARGYGCAFYSSAPSFCSMAASYDDADFSGATMCCACAVVVAPSPLPVGHSGSSGSYEQGPMNYPPPSPPPPSYIRLATD